MAVRCAFCGEEYKGLHLCTEPFDFIEPSKDWSQIIVSGSGYTQQKTIEPFDLWFASIERYVEERL